MVDQIFSGRSEDKVKQILKTKLYREFPFKKKSNHYQLKILNFFWFSSQIWAQASL